MKARFFSVVPVLVMLSACSTLGYAPTDNGDAASKWERRSAQIGLIRDWSLKGRAVVKNGRKSWHFGLYWQSSADEYSLELRTPLGQGMARLHAGTAGAELQIPNEPTLRSGDARTLLAQRFGWKLPTSLMTRWVLGLPALQGKGGLPVLDGRGVALEIREAGWDVRYRRYTESSGYLLPAMIVMNRGGTEVRVVIDEWVIDG